MELFIDIETIPTARSDIRERCTAGVAPPGNYKSAEAIAKWWKENGEAQKDEAIAQTALNGTWGEALCIGWALDEGPVNVTYREDSESHLLSAWGDAVVNAANPQRLDRAWFIGLNWIGHNLAAFDIRFLWQRHKVCNIAVPFRFPLDRYPRGPYVYDTMTEWAGWNARIKQTDLELAFGFTRTDPLEHGGADVGAAYARGDHASIKAHCFQDVSLLRQIYRRMHS